MNYHELIKTKVRVGFKTFVVACLGAYIGAATIGSPVNAQSRSSYGLGLPRTAQSGAATRDCLYVTPLAPEDGARTLSTRPTFYWYVNLKPECDKNSINNDAPPTISFMLRDIPVQNGELQVRNQVPIFRTRSVEAKTGLYAYTLPESAPTLEDGVVKAWHIRWLNSGVAAHFNTLVMLESNQEAQQALSDASNNLDKARVYAQYGYWYDALDAYNIWIEASPNDDVARQERNDLLSDGLKGNSRLPRTSQSEDSNSIDEDAILAQLSQQIDAATLIKAEIAEK